MKLFAWLMIAFVPTVVGLSIARWHNSLHGNDPAMLVTTLWVALNSFSSIVAGTLTARKSKAAPFLRIACAGFMSIVIFGLNVAFTYFGGCILIL